MFNKKNIVTVSWLLFSLCIYLLQSENSHENLGAEDIRVASAAISWWNG